LIEDAQNKKENGLIKSTAKAESLDEEFIRAGVAEGIIVIPKNVNRKLRKIVAVGKGLKQKLTLISALRPIILILRRNL